MRYLIPLGVLLPLGCEPELEPPPEATDSGGAGLGELAGAVRLEPQADLDRAPPVLRVRAPWRDGDPAAHSELGVFSGELGEYHLGRIERGDMPATLLERAVPVARWLDRAAGEIVVAPLTALEPGAHYTVAGVGRGLLATLQVRTEALPPLYQRAWPPAGASCGSSYVLYCGSSAPPRAQPIRLDPGRAAAVLRPGADAAGTADDHCLHWTTSGGAPNEQPMLPPPAVGAVALEPVPLLPGTCAAADVLPCNDHEERWVNGCADVQDDRVVVRVPLRPTLWMISGDVPPYLALPSAGGQFELRGLTPSSSYRIEIAMTDLSGRTERIVHDVETRPPQPHLVLNEVLANAVGPEPEQEWIEIYNDGAVAVPLAGWVLQDSGGPTELPDYLLDPSEYAVLLDERYVADAELDVVPAATAAWLRVPRLGRNGLSNAGELLRLLSPDGAVVSRFPAIAATEPGVSLARRDPGARAGEPGAFGLHRAPGASPGQPNQLR